MTEERLNKINDLRDKIHQQRGVVKNIESFISGVRSCSYLCVSNGLESIFLLDDDFYTSEVVHKALARNKAKLAELEKEFEEL